MQDLVQHRNRQGHLPSGKSPSPSQARKNSTIARSGASSTTVSSFRSLFWITFRCIPPLLLHLVRYTVKLLSRGSVGPRPGRSSNSQGSSGGEFSGGLPITATCRSPVTSSGRVVSQPQRNVAGGRSGTNVA